MLGNINFWLCVVELFVLRYNDLNFGFCSICNCGFALQVSVRFFTTLREVTGKREEALKFRDGETVTVNMILALLAKKYGKSFSEYVYDHKTREIKGFLQFLVNGRSASAYDGLDTKLANGDVLAIIPPVGGG